MGEALELSLNEWRQIAHQAKNTELRDYLNGLYGVAGSEKLVLHPVKRDERDTGKQAAVHEGSLLSGLRLS